MTISYQDLEVGFVLAEVSRVLNLVVRELLLILGEHHIHGGVDVVVDNGDLLVLLVGEVVVVVRIPDTNNSTPLYSQ